MAIQIGDKIQTPDGIRVVWAIKGNLIFSVKDVELIANLAPSAHHVSECQKVEK